MLDVCSEKLHLRFYLEMLWSKTGYFGLLGNSYILFEYPIMSYQKIKVYRVETKDMGRSHWNNGVSGTILLEQ